MTPDSPDFPLPWDAQDDSPGGFYGLPGGVSILLVDDEPEDVLPLAEMLRRAGARVSLATDGFEALRLALEAKPCLILLDILLPPTDGFTVCRELQDGPDTRDIPVLFLSGKTDAATKLRGFAAGGRDYVTKPFVAAEVLARVMVHVDLGRRTIPGSLIPRRSEQVPSWLVRAVDLIRRDLAATPKLSELAAAIGTNPTRLNEEFRARLGLTVFAFLRESRLKEARRLLMETNLPIREIGHRVGYPQPTNFATAFRERFGISPRQLRREPS